MDKTGNIILDKTLVFALDIIKYCELMENRKKYVIARQLLKSGTSIGANIRESQNAETKKNFIHKFKIAAKEIEETFYWLELFHISDNYPPINDLKDQLVEISKIASKIIITSKRIYFSHFQINSFSN